MTEKSKEKKKVKTLTKERVDLQELSKILSGGLSVAGQSAVRTDARRPGWVFTRQNPEKPSSARLDKITQ
jgi:hypothetical protein